MTIVIPTGIRENVSYIYRFPTINSGAARRAFRANFHTSHVSAKSREARGGGTMQIIPLLVRKPDRTEQAFPLRLNQPSNDFKSYRQRRPGGNQPQNVRHRLTGRKPRLPLRAVTL